MKFYDDPSKPSRESLDALGIKVRDFGFENTLSPVRIVPRVRRQVQPASRALKRERPWDYEEGDSPPPVKKPKPLERERTEPLLEPAVPRTERISRIRRVCSIILPALPRFAATSLLIPPLPPRDSDLPFVVRVDDTAIIPTSRADAEPCRPTRYTTFTLGSRASSRCSPAPSPQHASPAPLTRPLPPPNKELEADPRVRKPRGCGTAATISTPPAARSVLAPAK